MFMLGFSGTINNVAVASRVHWYGHVLRSEDGHVLIRALDCEVEGQRMKGRLKRTWKTQVEEESISLVCEGKMHFAVYSALSA